MLKVLIVDDDDIVLLVQSKILQRCEISQAPLKFKSAKEALRFLYENKEDSQYLIFLDINMPEMSGWDFLNEIKKNNLMAQSRVVMVTSSIDSYDKSKAATYDYVIDYIEKPINSRDCERIKLNPFLAKFS